jgi:hypothetical protein
MGELPIWSLRLLTTSTESRRSVRPSTASIPLSLRAARPPEHIAHPLPSGDVWRSFTSFEFATFTDSYVHEPRCTAHSESLAATIAFKHPGTGGQCRHASRPLDATRLTAARRTGLKPRCPTDSAVRHALVSIAPAGPETRTVSSVMSTEATMNLSQGRTVTHAFGFHEFTVPQLVTRWPGRTGDPPEGVLPALSPVGSQGESKHPTLGRLPLPSRRSEAIMANP